MNPLDKPPARDRTESPRKQEHRPAGNSGRGAASALEHLIHQEKVRFLHSPKDAHRERAPAQI
jgi:hypothetical protein